MRRSLFWLSDEQWARIEPHLPTDVRGVERVDDRRVAELRRDRPQRQAIAAQLAHDRDYWSVERIGVGRERHSGGLSALGTGAGRERGHCGNLNIPQHA